MTNTTTARPGYRKPWEHGAKAYAEADTFADLAEGMKRKRSEQWVTMPHSAVGHLPCGVCGVRLDAPYQLNPGEDRKVRDDGTTTIRYQPKAKAINAAHYYCGWGALIGEIIALRDYI